MFYLQNENIFYIFVRAVGPSIRLICQAPAQFHIGPYISLFPFSVPMPNLCTVNAIFKPTIYFQYEMSMFLEGV